MFKNYILGIEKRLLTDKAQEKHYIYTVAKASLTGFLNFWISVTKQKYFIRFLYQMCPDADYITSFLKDFYLFLQTDRVQ